MNPYIGPALFGILGTGGLAGVGILYLRKRVELNADKERVELQADPLVLLKEEIARSDARTAAREKELSELRSADRQERDEYLKTLTSIGKAMDEMAADLKALREEERTGRAKVHERLDGMDDRLLVIETRLEKPA